MWHQPAQHHEQGCSGFSPELMPGVLVKLEPSVSKVPRHVPTGSHLQLKGVDTFLSVLPALTDLSSRASALQRSGCDVWRPGHMHVSVCVCEVC